MNSTKTATRIAGTNTRKDGLYLIFLGAGVILALVIYILLFPTSTAYYDFRPHYFAGRALLQGRDPYNPTEVLRAYQPAAGENAFESNLDREALTNYLYPPTTLTVIVPFAILPWRIARVAWLILSMGVLILASVLAWDLGADYAPILSGAFVAFLLANSLVITVLCNLSGLAISLCVIAIWCLMRDRHVYAGILLLALSLAIKPQDPGFVWLYFLLARGVNRKRAVYSLLAAIAIGLPALLSVSWVAPHWIPELHSNLQALTGHGRFNDPGPASTGAGTMVNLQVVFSRLRDDPRFYSAISYVIFVLLLAMWCFTILRSRFSLKNAWLAIAAIVPLSLLPVYHQLYDTKLLLLTVPGLAILWIDGGLIRWVSLLVESAAFFFTGDISGAIYRYSLNLLSQDANQSKTLAVVPVPLVLLAMGIFYLWAYIQYARKSGNRLEVAQPMVQT
ncbi:MAG TPA: glycosyltransferase family 87 protein [Terracidiphilus sp.]|nr:glycosyltransferase family 87 protein [Terracidiphilus sp.]